MHDTRRNCSPDCPKTSVPRTTDSERMIGWTGKRLVSFEINSDRPAMVSAEEVWVHPYLMAPDGQFIIGQSSSRGWRFEQVHAQTSLTTSGVQVPSPGTQFMGLAHDGKVALAMVNSRLLAY